MRADLTAEMVRELLEYDEHTGVFRNRVKRHRTEAGVIVGCNNGSGYLSIPIQKFNYKAHRLAWLYHYGEWPSQFIDHINGNRSDNRIANLRLANPCENARNMRGKRNGLKGATPRPYGRWAAHIFVNGRNKKLGTFATEQEAHAAYIAAAKTYYGEFARAA